MSWYGERATLAGPIRVRLAEAGERLTTLDGQDRVLDADDLLEPTMVDTALAAAARRPSAVF